VKNSFFNDSLDTDYLNEDLVPTGSSYYALSAPESQTKLQI
jgi:hypothetical protein